MRKSVILMCFVVGCSSAPSSGTSQDEANPCATPGASYLATFTELSGGTCGTISPELENINPNGTITSTVEITCASSSQDGCTTRDTDCTWSADGFTFTGTSEATFYQDGSYATGIESITGVGDGQSCVSTYDVSLVRQ